MTRWRKLHELQPWDALAIFRVQNGMAMRGHHAPDEWQRILAAHRAPPPAPTVRAVVAEGVIRLHPEGAPSQLELGVLVAGLHNLRVTNGRDVIDPLLPWRLQPLIGRDAFTTANSWRRRDWPVPLELARDGQPYAEDWDALARGLADAPDRLFTVGEIVGLAHKAIAATLTGAAADHFWRANR